tara:strand:- start:511 stop:840 length:330 start_codon:yes stop_codon:yes gene_type:complete
MISYKKYFVLAFFVLVSENTLALNFSNIDKKIAKANIKTVEDYKSYRLEQLQALRNKGMSNAIYLRELERMQNITQLPPSDITKQLDINIEDIRSFDKLEITRDFKNTQ